MEGQAFPSREKLRPAEVLRSAVSSHLATWPSLADQPLLMLLPPAPGRQDPVKSKTWPALECETLLLDKADTAEMTSSQLAKVRSCT